MAMQNGLFGSKEDMPDALSGVDTTYAFESPLNTSEGRAKVQSFMESVQILAGAANFDETVPTMMDFKQATKDAVKGTGAPADWFKDDDTQESDEQQAKNVAGLQAAATALQQGAGVATEVATATQALQQAGLA
jgi:hypothetical protein